MPILKTKFQFIKISVRENAIPKIRRKFIAKDHFTEESRPDSKIRSMKKEKKREKPLVAAIYNRDPRYSRVKFDDEVVNQPRKSVR